MKTMKLVPAWAWNAMLGAAVVNIVGFGLNTVPKINDLVTTDSFEKLCEKGGGQTYHDICVKNGVVRFNKSDLDKWEKKHGDWEDYKPSTERSV